MSGLDDTEEVVCYGTLPRPRAGDTSKIPAGGTAVIARGRPGTAPPPGRVTVSDLGAAQDVLDRLAAAGAVDRTLTVLAPNVYVISWR